MFGCATLKDDRDRIVSPGTTIKVRWIWHDTPYEVARACGSSIVVSCINGFCANRTVVNNRVTGCYDWDGDVCVIQTLKLQAPMGSERTTMVNIDGGIMAAAGEELGHCYRGYMHTEDKI